MSRGRAGSRERDRGGKTAVYIWRDRRISISSGRSGLSSSGPGCSGGWSENFSLRKNELIFVLKIANDLSQQLKTFKREFLYLFNEKN
jgi:hypothetical protein